MAPLPGRRLRSLPHHRPQLRASGDAAAGRPVARHLPRPRRLSRRAPRVSRRVARRASARPATDGGDESRAEDLVREPATRNELVAAAVVPAEPYRRRAKRRASRVQPSMPSLTRIETPLAARPAGGNRVELLHVGSTIPRKRIDVLLNVVAALRRQHPGVRLIQVGGPFTTSQRRLAGRLGLDDYVAVLPFVTPRGAGRRLSTRRSAAADLGSRRVRSAGCRSDGVRNAGRGQRPARASRGRRPGGHLLSCRGRGAMGRCRGRAPRGARDDAERWRARQADGIDWARRFDWQAHARATRMSIERRSPRWLRTTAAASRRCDR